MYGVLFSVPVLLGLSWRICCVVIVVSHSELQGARFLPASVACLAVGARGFRLMVCLSLGTLAALNHLP